MMNNQYFEIEKLLNRINVFIQNAKDYFKNGNYPEAHKFCVKALDQTSEINNTFVIQDSKQNTALSTFIQDIKQLSHQLSEIDSRFIHKNATQTYSSITQSLSSKNISIDKDNKITKNNDDIKPVPHTGVTFDDVVGCEEIKDFIIQQWELRFNKDYQNFSVDNQSYPLFDPSTLERGILFYGMPGTGKTFVAKAIATKVNATFFAISASDLLSKYKGDTVQKMRQVFEQAAKEPRAIIFIDEIDSILMKQSERSDQHNVQDLNEWLTLMNGISVNGEAFDKLLFIATTNNPNMIAPAALRPGRFGKHVRIDIPDLKTREMLINKLINKNQFTKKLVLDVITSHEIAIRTAGFTQSDIQAVISRIINSINSKVLTSITKRIAKKEPNANVFQSQEFSIRKDDIILIIKTANKSDSKEVLQNLAEFEEERSLRPLAGGVKEHHATILEEARLAAEKVGIMPKVT